MTDAEFESVYQDWHRRFDLAMKGECRVPSLLQMLAERIAQKVAEQVVREVCP